MTVLPYDEICIVVSNGDYQIVRFGDFITKWAKWSGEWHNITPGFEASKAAIKQHEETK